MDVAEFRRHGKEMVDLIADYWETLETRRPMPDIQPGFMSSMIPDEPPETPEQWAKILADVEPVVLQTNTNWHHPLFFAYYPTACSYPSIIADMLSGAIASIGFTWKSSPSMTELEMKMTDWLASAIGLPEFFMNSHDGPGAGMIQCTASDATFVAVLAARARAVANLKSSRSPLDKLSDKVSSLNLRSAISNIFDGQPKEEEVITFTDHDPAFFGRLVAYCSEQAHCSVSKGIMLAGVRMRKIRSSTANSTGNYCLDAEALKAAIHEDRTNGLVPFILIATVGTTSTCAVDELQLLGPICREEKLWLHVDAAYAGSFLLCPETRGMIEGIEFADSFNFNPHKAMMINFDCSPLWFRDAREAIRYFNVDAEYLKHEHQSTAIDYRHLQIALGRRFRSLKIWFVLRALGLERIREYQRKQIRLAGEFEKLLLNDDRFELVVPPNLGLVCFRLRRLDVLSVCCLQGHPTSPTAFHVYSAPDKFQGDNHRTQRLLDRLNADGRIHLVAGKIADLFFLRLAVCSQRTDSQHIGEAFAVIAECANDSPNESTGSQR